MRRLLFILFLIITLASKGQTTISGFVSDSLNGEKLIGATIYDLYTKKGCVSDTYGFFSMNVENPDSSLILISFTGYGSKMIKADTAGEKILNVRLKYGMSLSAVEITAYRSITMNESGNLRIPIERIEYLPSIGGEVDLMKAIQLMPGVSSEGEGSSSLLVRGGGPDQNLILLDGVPLYYVNHLGGFVSVFNSDAINNINFYKSDFPASFGGRMSSVLDIRMKDGNSEKISANYMLGIISSKIMIDGPIKKDKLDFMFSARRMLFDLFSKPLSSHFFGTSTGYTFYDINGKLNYKFSEKDRLYFSTYLGDDLISIKTPLNEDGYQKLQTRWGNNLFSLRWNRVWNSKIISDLAVTNTRFRFEMEGELNTNVDGSEFRNLTAFYSGIQDYSVLLNNSYYVSNNQTLKFGASFIKHKFSPGATSFSEDNASVIILDSVIGSNTVLSDEIVAYIEDKVNLGVFSFNGGIRFTGYILDSASFISFHPRTSFSYKFKESTLYLSFSKLTQNVHMLSTSGIGMPYDLWLPATKNATPAFAYHYCIGFNTSVYKKKLPLSFQVFYKDMHNLIMYKEGATLLNSAFNWEQLIETEGKGKSYGAELLLEKNTGRLTGWFSYTISKTDRQFDNLNSGNPFPYTYDNRHIINLAAVYKLKENVILSAIWSYKSGNAITLATGKYYYFSDSTMVYPQTIQYYSGVNDLRMRAYHRLDIGISLKKERKRGIRTWTISIYNLYNRQNPYYYYFHGSGEGTLVGNSFIGDNSLVLMQRSLFPFIPSVSYSFRFK